MIARVANGKKTVLISEDSMMVIAYNILIMESVKPMSEIIDHLIFIDNLILELNRKNKPLELQLIELDRLITMEKDRYEDLLNDFEMYYNQKGNPNVH